MHSKLAIALCGVLLSVNALQAYAVSVGIANIAFPSYGSAEHFDQSNEFLGVNGTAYDGISFGEFLTGAMTTLTITPNVGAFFGTGDFEFLSVWIDWDHSRVWESDEEVVNLDDQMFALGKNPLTFSIPVPSEAILGDTWLRARFSFDGDLTPAGFLYTGEVEDYQVNVKNNAVVPEPLSILLLLGGLAGLAGKMRLRRTGSG